MSSLHFFRISSENSLNLGQLETLMSDRKFTRILFQLFDAGQVPTILNFDAFCVQIIAVTDNFWKNKKGKFLIFFLLIKLIKKVGNQSQPLLQNNDSVADWELFLALPDPTFKTFPDPDPTKYLELPPSNTFNNLIS